ncbi:MAG: type II toxin-antitoxin system VapC family toxin [Chloroflexota bacterium]|nr:type II toxin-antitoxin system VapC family toxin [Chloroflexota bacterium]
MFVLDASGAIELVLNTAAGKRIASRLDDPAETVHAPHLIDVEVAHVLRRYASLGALSDRRCEQALSHWRELDVERHSHDLFLDRIRQLCHNVSAYDAAYVTLTEALSTVLVTGDGRLARVPGLAIRIELP